MSTNSIAQPSAGPTTLLDALWQEREETKWIRFAVFAILGSIAIWISAKIKIPIEPVPVTMQTFVILALSMAMGWRLAGATVLLYLAQGAMGLPVFTGTPEKGIGLAYMVGPTGGYLVGYLLAAVTVGWLAERGWDRGVLMTALAMLIGNALIYLPGVPYLMALIGFEKGLYWGFTYFVVYDLLKLALAAAILPLIWSMISKRSARD